MLRLRGDRARCWRGGKGRAVPRLALAGAAAGARAIATQQPV